MKPLYPLPVDLLQQPLSSIPIDNRFELEIDMLRVVASTSRYGYCTLHLQAQLSNEEEICPPSGDENDFATRLAHRTMVQREYHLRCCDTEYSIR